MPVNSFTKSSPRRPNARPSERPRKKRRSRRARLSPTTSAKAFNGKLTALFPYLPGERPSLSVCSLSLKHVDNTQARLRIRLEQNLHAVIMASRRAPHSGQIACARRALRRRLINVPRRAAANSNAHDLRAVRSLFSSIRTRRSNRPPPTPLLGVCAFNDPALQISETTTFRFPVLNDPDNFTRQHRDAQLWWEKTPLSCCKSGAAVIPRLRPVSGHNWRIFNSEEFSTSQRKYNGLLSYTALGARGCEPKTWANPAPPSMLTLHGKAYRRIFDLEEKIRHHVCFQKRKILHLRLRSCRSGPTTGRRPWHCRNLSEKLFHGLDNIVLLPMILLILTPLDQNLPS